VEHDKWPVETARVAGAAGVALRFGLRDSSNWLANLFSNTTSSTIWSKQHRHASFLVSASRDVQAYCLSEAIEVLRL
jgi:hypothetical protein